MLDWVAQFSYIVRLGIAKVQDGWLENFDRSYTVSVGERHHTLRGSNFAHFGTR
jgi:hypothetical protein